VTLLESCQSLAAVLISKGSKMLALLVYSWTYARISLRQ
jgi:hypothetical protein